LLLRSGIDLSQNYLVMVGLPPARRCQCGQRSGL